MSDIFPLFGNAVRNQYDSMKSSELYLVDYDRSAIWDHYLASFPEGSNLVYRERTEHDCSCCKSFIRNIGPVVSIVNGAMISVWDIPSVGEPYDTVAKAMSNYVNNLPVKTVFRTKKGEYGAEETPELRDGKTFRWDHFSGKTSTKHKMTSGIGEYRSGVESRHQVMSRGLDEITTEAVDDVLELIQQGTLYRGNEHKKYLEDFKVLQSQYKGLGNNKELWSWEHIDHGGARIRNSVVGTLIVDLSEGVDLETAVKKFEAKVAPANYQRPKALITPRMIDSALAKIDELGLRDSLERRHAKFSDVSVNDVLFVDNNTKVLMRDSLRDTLMSEVSSAPVRLDDASEISASEFISTVLPKCSSVKALFENCHVPNLMSMTAPVHENSSRIFKWSNSFAWSYNGDVADSDIAQRVKAAGGNTNAVLRVSLSWSNYDDLDLHMTSEEHGEVFYSSPKGILDVDMNARGRGTRSPVENMQFSKMPPDGDYLFSVNQYARREHIDVGFTLEVFANGQLSHYHYNMEVAGKIQSLNLKIRNGLVEIDVRNDRITNEAIAQDAWGISTLQLVPINSIIRSPNYWNDNSGNEHWFFIAEGCENPDPVRCFYNEYLSPEVHAHRKVFEVLGAKSKAPHSNDQMSGLGFSSTKRAHLTVVVQGSDFNRAYSVQF